MNEVKKSKSFENNKLINPDIIEYENSDDEDDENSILEFDDESLEIINKIRNRNTINESIIFNNNNNSKKVNTPTKVKKQKKNLSLQDFIKTHDSENKIDNKKFISNRVENKKKEFQSDTFEQKRQFNPKKPPYNFTRKSLSNNIPEFKNIQEFPELIN